MDMFKSTVEVSSIKTLAQLYIIRCPQKLSQMFFAMSSKIIQNFHYIWHVAMAVYAEQRALKLSNSPCVCTHTHTLLYNVTGDKIVA